MIAADVGRLYTMLYRLVLSVELVFLWVPMVMLLAIWSLGAVGDQLLLPAMLGVASFPAVWRVYLRLLLDEPEGLSRWDYRLLMVGFVAANYMVVLLSYDRVGIGPLAMLFFLPQVLALKAIWLVGRKRRKVMA